MGRERVDLPALLLACAPLIAPDTAMALMTVESSLNPFAIGVVNGSLMRQPRSLPEALATVDALEAGGWNYSVGLAQINKSNFSRYGLTRQTAFEPCNNLRAMEGILGECFARATKHSERQAALRKAFSCYYSGNFQTGFDHGYVGKVLNTWQAQSQTVKGSPSSPTKLSSLASFH